MFSARNSSAEPIIVNVSLNQVPVTIELNTGASLSARIRTSTSIQLLQLP